MSYQARHLAVIPAFDEAATIGAVIDSVELHAPQYDVLVVDDGSTDDTAAMAERLGTRVVRHPFNLGIGGAVQSGFKYALEHGYDYVVQVDGDGQHDPGEIAKLHAVMDDDPAIDVVVGSRFLTS